MTGAENLRPRTEEAISNRVNLSGRIQRGLVRVGLAAATAVVLHGVASNDINYIPIDAGAAGAAIGAASVIDRNRTRTTCNDSVKVYAKEFGVPVPQENNPELPPVDHTRLGRFMTNQILPLTIQYLNVSGPTGIAGGLMKEIATHNFDSRMSTTIGVAATVSSWLVRDGEARHARETILKDIYFGQLDRIDEMRRGY